MFAGLVDSLPKMSDENSVVRQLNYIKQFNQFTNVSIGNPIKFNSLIDGLFPKLHLILSTDIDVSVIQAKKFISYILNLPDQLINFSDVTFPDNSFFVSLLKQVQDYEVLPNDEIAKKLELICPLLIRCDFDLIFGIGEISHILHICKNIPNSSDFFKTIQIHCLIHQLKVNLTQKTFFSTILSSISKLLYELSNSNFSISILPYLTNNLSLIICEIIKIIQANEINATEKIFLMKTIPLSMLTIATVYPLSLELIDWMRYLTIFSKQNNNSQIFPDYDYCIKYPEKCSSQCLCDNIFALMTAHRLFFHIANPNDAGIYIRFLHLLAASSPLGQNAVIRAMKNVGTLSFFEQSKISYNKLISKYSMESCQLILDIFNNNYSEDLIQVDKIFDFSRISINVINPQQKQGYELITRLFNPFKHLKNSLPELSRSVDSVLYHLDIGASYEMLTSHFIQHAKSIIDSTMKTNICILDFRYGIMFSHTCASMMMLSNILKPLEFQVNTFYSVDFILRMFDHILSCCKVAGHQEINYYDATMNREIERFCSILTNYADTFFSSIFALVNESLASLAYAAIVLFAKTLEIDENMNFPQFGSKLVSETPCLPWEWAMHFISSDSPVVHYTATECLKTFICRQPDKFNFDLFEAIVSSLRKKKSAKLINSLLVLFSESNGKVRSRLFDCGMEEILINTILENYFKESITDDENKINIIVCDLIYCLVSDTFSGNFHYIIKKEVISALSSRCLRLYHILQRNKNYKILLNVLTMMSRLCEDTAFMIESFCSDIELNFENIEDESIRTACYNLAIRTILIVHRYNHDYGKVLYDIVNHTDLTKFKNGEYVTKIMNKGLTEKDEKNFNPCDLEFCNDIEIQHLCTNTKFLHKLSDDHFFSPNVISSHDK